ncbi:hypothetical protein [Streptomyces sp. CA-111067]|uniref:hypothetical protein n=1 Tax=Streptomyces sp. CA-111067 TaxID=3240046 RepID=UPI003D99292C
MTPPSVLMSALRPWAAVRRPWTVLLALAAYAGLMLVVREDVANVPSITMQGSAGVKVMNFLPLIVCLAVLHCLDRRLDAAERTGVRPVLAADRCLVLATAAVALAIGAAMSALLDMATAPAAGRNVVFLTGLALAVRAAGSTSVAGSVTAGWLFLTATTGLRAPDRPYPWAVLLQPAAEPVALAATAGVLALGLAMMSRGPHRA